MSLFSPPLQLAMAAAAIASLQYEGRDSDSTGRPPLAECQCCSSTADEAQVWLRCVASGLLPNEPLLPLPVSPPVCPLLSSLLTSPLLECVALLDSFAARLSPTPAPTTATATTTAAAIEVGAEWMLRWSVATHHVLHAIFSQLRDESAPTVLSSCRALRSTLKSHPAQYYHSPPLHPPHPQSHSHSHSHSLRYQLSAASHIMLATGLTSVITACLAATGTATATTTTATTTTTTTTITTAASAAASIGDTSFHAPRESSDGAVGQLADSLLSHFGDGDLDSTLPLLSSLVVPPAEQLVRFTAALDQLSARNSSEASRDVGSNNSANTAVCRRLTRFVCSLLPPTCPHSPSPASDDSNGAVAMWLWTSVSWRLVALHIRPMLRFMTHSQQTALISSVLRPCSRCCLNTVVLQQSHTVTVDTPPFALPTASQQLMRLPSLTDSSAFVTHLVAAVAGHITRILNSHTSSTAQPSHKRKRASSKPVTSAQSPRPAADYIAQLLELMSLLRSLSQAPAECWQQDHVVSHIRITSRVPNFTTLPSSRPYAAIVPHLVPLHVPASQSAVWSPLSELCDWLHVIRNEAASCDPNCINAGGGRAAAASATCAADMFVWSPSTQSLLAAARAAASTGAAVVNVCTRCVCNELCFRLLVAARGLQVMCVQRAVDASSAVLLPLLSLDSVWCSLLADIQSRARASDLHVAFALLLPIQRILAGSVRLAMSVPVVKSSSLFHYLFDVLCPALQSALSFSSDDALPPSESAAGDISALSGVLRTAPRSLVYRLLVSACVAAADCCVGQSLPTAVQSMWRHVLPVVDIAATSVSQLTHSLSLSLSPGVARPPSPLTVSSYAVGLFSLVRCLTSSVAPASLLPLLDPTDTAPSPAELLAWSLSTAFDLLASPSSADLRAANDSSGLRVQCGEFILFALTTAAGDHKRHPPQQQSYAAYLAALPPLRSLTEQLLRALAVSSVDDNPEVCELIHRAFITVVASHIDTHSHNRPAAHAVST